VVWLFVSRKARFSPPRPTRTMADFFDMPDADEEVNNTIPQEQPPAIPASSYEYEDEDVEPEGLPEPEPEDALA
jgi:hypothetical protein